MGLWLNGLENQLKPNSYKYTRFFTFLIAPFLMKFLLKLDTFN